MACEATSRVSAGNGLFTVAHAQVQLKIKKISPFGKLEGVGEKIVKEGSKGGG